MVSPDVKASVVEELENRDILPSKSVSNLIAAKSNLDEHIASIATASDSSLADSPITATADINYWRNKFRNKMPVSDSSVASAIEDGIEKVISNEPRKPGYKNMTDMLKRLGIRSVGCADDVCMALF